MPKTKQFCKLFRGGALQIMRGLPDHSVDMVMADPPYGITACGWDSAISLSGMWEQLERIVKPKGVIVLMAAQPFTSVLIVSNINMFSCNWVWVKNTVTNNLNAKKQPLRCCEDVVVFAHSGHVYNPQGVKGCSIVESTGNFGGKGNSMNYGAVGVGLYHRTQTNYPRQVLKFNAAVNTVHPTQKPVLLMSYLIRTYSEAGAVVLDFCMGSGTTGVAAKKLRRSFIGVELDKDYYAIAEKRIKEA